MRNWRERTEAIPRNTLTEHFFAASRTLLTPPPQFRLPLDLRRLRQPPLGRHLVDQVEHAGPDAILATSYGKRVRRRKRCRSAFGQIMPTHLGETDLMESQILETCVAEPLIAQ